MQKDNDGFVSDDNNNSQRVQKNNSANSHEKSGDQSKKTEEQSKALEQVEKTVADDFEMISTNYRTIEKEIADQEDNYVNKNLLEQMEKEMKVHRQRIEERNKEAMDVEPDVNSKMKVEKFTKNVMERKEKESFEEEKSKIRMLTDKYKGFVGYNEKVEEYAEKFFKKIGEIQAVSCIDQMSNLKGKKAKKDGKIISINDLNKMKNSTNNVKRLTIEENFLQLKKKDENIVEKRVINEKTKGIIKEEIQENIKRIQVIERNIQEIQCERDLDISEGNSPEKNNQVFISLNIIRKNNEIIEKEKKKIEDLKEKLEIQENVERIFKTMSLTNTACLIICNYCIQFFSILMDISALRHMLVRKEFSVKNGLKMLEEFKILEKQMKKLNMKELDMEKYKSSWQDSIILSEKNVLSQINNFSKEITRYYWIYKMICALENIEESFEKIKENIFKINKCEQFLKILVLVY
ncbi:viral A-type inclusion protein, partial [Reticulomyxa filosa]